MAQNNFKAHVKITGTAYTTAKAPSYEEATTMNERALLSHYEGRKLWSGWEYKDQVFKDVDWDEIKHESRSYGKEFYFVMKVNGYIDVVVSGADYHEAEINLENVLSDIEYRIGLHDIYWDVEKWENY